MGSGPEMTWMCNCGALVFEIDENYEVEQEAFEKLAINLGHWATESSCEPTT